MEKIKLQVSGSQIQVVQRPAAITAGTVGLEAEFSFDSHWENLGKTVIFRAGDKAITAALEGDTHIVPWEVLEKPDLWLVVGVYGANAEGTVVIPTLWTKVAAIYTGVEPEGDPALEPANPIWQQTVARVANMEPQLQEHINNMNNPHGITCGQIGAVTQKEFRDVVSNLDGSSDPEGLIPHLLNRDNPHGVTAAQAGAAPAGYGLGENSSPNGNWSHGYNNSFTRGNTNSPDNAMWYGITCVNGKSDACSTHIAFSQNAGNSLCEARRSRNSAGTWGEWEYVNPPMLEGVEYRTTERFGGKSVFLKNVDGVIRYRLDGETNWKPYANAVGAAPAGFGLGEAVGNYETVADANTATKSGWYKVHSTTANGVGYVGLMRVDGYSTTNVVQTVYQFNRTDFCPTMQRVCLNGTWGDWVWVNPPLMSGVEYRTTKLHEGKPVYTKQVNLQGVSAGGTKTVNHGIENILTPLNVKVFDADGTITEAATYLRFTKTDISFTLPSGVGGKIAYGIFEYTKTTED